VLQGGGAKGAYALGWLLECRARGVEFDAVSGTSVGGLNAILWTTDNLEEGQELWTTISQPKVYPFRSLPYWLALPVRAVSRYLYEKMEKVGLAPRVQQFLILLIFVQLGFVILERWSYLWTFSTIVGASVVAIWLLLRFALGFTSFQSTRKIAGLFLIALQVLFVLDNWDSVSTPKYRPENEVISSPDSILAGEAKPEVANDGSADVPDEVRFRPGRSETVDYDRRGNRGVIDRVHPKGKSFKITIPPPVSYSLALFFTIAFISILAMVVVYLVFLGCELLNISTLSSKPLSRLVGQYLKRDLSIPTFVTVAREQDLWDPVDLVEEPKPPTEGGKTYVAKRGYVPVHVCLNTEPCEAKRMKYALASAALPYGIVPSIEVDGVMYVDGGMSDNEPVHPLICREPCDIVVAVLLTPCKDKEYVRSKWFDVARAVRIGSLKSTDVLRRRRGADDQVIDPGVSVDVPEPFPAIITVAPNQDLGNLITGTLNFNLHLPSWLSTMGSRVLPASLRHIIDRQLTNWNLKGDYTDSLIKLGQQDAAGRSDEFWRMLRDKDVRAAKAFVQSAVESD